MDLKLNLNNGQVVGINNMEDAAQIAIFKLVSDFYTYKKNNRSPALSQVFTFNATNQFNFSEINTMCLEI